MARQAKEKKKQREKREKLSPNRLGQESVTPMQDQSAISNNDPFASAPQTLPLFVFHKSVLALKCKIIRLLSFLFYKPEQYGLANYICHVVESKFMREIGQKITTDRYKGHEERIRDDMEDLLVVPREDINIRFHDSDNILKKLKDSCKMVMDRGSDAVTINHSFFNMLSSICESLLQKNQQEQRKLSDREQVTCKQCRKKRPLYEWEAKIKCYNCNSMEIDAKDSTEIRTSMKILEQQIGRVKKWKADIQELERKQAERLVEERNKNYQAHRVTDVDKDIQGAMEYISSQKEIVRDFVSPFPSYKIKVNGANIESAQKQFAPRRNYRSILQLAQARKRRKQQKANSMELIL